MFLLLNDTNKMVHTQILQVFVQQTLTTSYETSNCNCNDVCE